MLRIDIKETELWDESTQTFIPIKKQTIMLEHSLLAISKWESKYHKLFLSKEKKTKNELLYYIECMTVTPSVDPAVYASIDRQSFKKIEDYIADPMTATTFSKKEEQTHGLNREQISSELIYYWMIAFQIPFECQKWHINRLMTLIKICNIKNNPGKKRKSGDIAASNAALNAQRRKMLGGKG